MKFKLKTYTRVVISAQYLGSTMEIDYYGSKKPSKEMVLSLCRDQIKEFRYHKATQEYDLFVASEQEGYISRHTSVKVSESLHQKIDALLSEKFMFHPGNEAKKDAQHIKVLELFESAPKMEVEASV